MSRKRKVPVSIYISEDIAEKLSRVKRGFKSTLVEKLLREFFERVGDDEGKIITYILDLDIDTNNRRTKKNFTKTSKRKEEFSLPDEDDFF